MQILKPSILHWTSTYQYYIFRDVPSVVTRQSIMSTKSLIVPSAKKHKCSSERSVSITRITHPHWQMHSSARFFYHSTGKRSRCVIFSNVVACRRFAVYRTFFELYHGWHMNADCGIVWTEAHESTRSTSHGTKGSNGEWKWQECGMPCTNGARAGVLRVTQSPRQLTVLTDTYLKTIRVIPRQIHHFLRLIFRTSTKLKYYIIHVETGRGGGGLSHHFVGFEGV